MIESKVDVIIITIPELDGTYRHRYTTLLRKLTGAVGIFQWYHIDLSIRRLNLVFEVVELVQIFITLLNSLEDCCFQLKSIGSGELPAVNQCFELRREDSLRIDLRTEKIGFKKQS